MTQLNMTLADELAQLEDELAELNERRIDLYRRSLESAMEDKCCDDLVANAMLSGPLSAGEKMEYPIQVNGIGWVDRHPPAYNRGHDPGWVAVQPIAEGDAKTYLGYHMGDVATIVRAQLDQKAGFLHLSHIIHVPVLFVPDKDLLALGTHTIWKYLETVEDLEQLTDPDKQSPWYIHAVKQLTIAKETAALASAPTGEAN